MSRIVSQQSVARVSLIVVVFTIVTDRDEEDCKKNEWMNAAVVHLSMAF